VDADFQLFLFKGYLTCKMVMARGAGKKVVRTYKDPSDNTSFADLLKANGRNLETVTDQHWACLYVKSQSENKIGLECMTKGIPFFFPLLKDSRKNISRPLWPNYIFCRLKKQQEHHFKSHSAVGRLLKPADEAELISYLKQFGAMNSISPGCLKGDFIRIVSGRLEGLKAKVEEVMDDGRKLRVSINILGKPLYLERNADEVELVSEDVPNITVIPFRDYPQEVKTEEEEKSTIPNALNLQLTEINSEFIKYLSKHPNLLYEIAPRRFELLVAELLKDMGYEVELTPETRDGGRDILAVFRVPHGKILTIVECKRYSPERTVGIEIIERFLWVIENKDRASCGLVATTSYFSPEARATEKQYQWKLTLKDFDGLKEWIGQYGTWVRRPEVGLWLPNSIYRTKSATDYVKDFALEGDTDFWSNKKS
jgi:restriction system protein